MRCGWLTAVGGCVCVFSFVSIWCCIMTGCLVHHSLLTCLWGKSWLTRTSPSILIKDHYRPWLDTIIIMYILHRVHSSAPCVTVYTVSICTAVYKHPCYIYEPLVKVHVKALDSTNSLSIVSSWRAFDTVGLLYAYFRRWCTLWARCSSVVWTIWWPYYVSIWRYCPGLR